MARMTLKEAMSRRSTIDWDRVRATSDEDIRPSASEDGTEGVNRH
jgi:putative transcriptional regulator